MRNLDTLIRKEARLNYELGQKHGIIIGMTIGAIVGVFLVIAYFYYNASLT